MAVYPDSFGNKDIPQKVLWKMKDKSITHNIFIIEGDDSITCADFTITFIEYMIYYRMTRWYINNAR